MSKVDAEKAATEHELMLIADRRRLYEFERNQEQASGGGQ
jgi:hypothetical protein